MVDIPAERFDELVGEALDEIPPALAARMDNVVVTVRDHPTEAGLLGLYEGIPLTEREGYGNGMVVPDRIILFRGPLCALGADEAEVREQVRITVIHEVAHHFGIDDDRLTELGWD